MTNHTQAAIARVETARRLDKLDLSIKILADTCEDLMGRDDRMLDAMKILQSMVEMNREEIKTIRSELQCLKQE
jgi:hypothetical protein